MIYTAFFADFGPLDLGITYRFCNLLSEQMRHAKEHRKPILYHAGNHPHIRTNSIVLLGAYLVSNII